MGVEQIDGHNSADYRFADTSSSLLLPAKQPPELTPALEQAGAGCAACEDGKSVPYLYAGKGAFRSHNRQERPASGPFLSAAFGCVPKLSMATPKARAIDTSK